MRCLALAGLLLLGAACSDTAPEAPPEPMWRPSLPPVALVDRVERQLAGRSCIGSLDQWQRNYDYPANDQTKIWFKLQQAGVHGYRAGRIIGLEGSSLDHRQFRMAHGIYDIETGRLTIDHCGWNCPANVPMDGNCG